MSRRSTFRSRALGTAVAVAAMFAFGAQSATAQEMTTGKCPGTFQVLHDDHVGKLQLPKGAYVIRVKNMPCDRASRNFTKFLADPEGNLPNGWKVIVKKMKFKKKPGKAFKVKPVNVKRTKGKGNRGR